MRTLRGADVVVTGGAGFLGSHLCAAALDSGARVFCVDDESSGRSSNVEQLVDSADFVFVPADVSERLPVESADVVVHLASTASPVHYRARPVATLRSGSLGTFNALELARACSARFVLASTSEVYGDPLVHPQPETYWGNVNPVGPRSCYDESKRFAEAAAIAYAEEHGADVGIARIFNTYGPRMRTDDGRVVPTFIYQALRSQPLTVAGDGRQTRSLCYVSDTVAALLALAVGESMGPVNVGNPEEIAMIDLAAEVARATGSGSEIEFVDLPVDDPHVRCPQIDRARDELGWSPTVSLREGLALTIEAFRADMQS